MGAIALGAVAFSSVVMLLWNATLTPIFHITAITLWQAAGLLLLSKILFSGFRGRNRMGWHHKRQMMYAHCQNLTEEQQEAFRRKMQGCRGYVPMQER